MAHLLGSISLGWYDRYMRDMLRESVQRYSKFRSCIVSFFCNIVQNDVIPVFPYHLHKVFFVVDVTWSLLWCICDDFRTFHRGFTFFFIVTTWPIKRIVVNATSNYGLEVYDATSAATFMYDEVVWLPYENITQASSFKPAILPPPRKKTPTHRSQRRHKLIRFIKNRYTEIVHWKPQFVTLSKNKTGQCFIDSLSII